MSTWESEQWSYEKPTTEGWYYVSNGDVTTPSNISFIYFVFDELNDILYDRLTGDGAHMFNKDCKFRPVDFDWFNRLGNK